MIKKLKLDIIGIKKAAEEGWVGEVKKEEIDFRNKE